MPTPDTSVPVVVLRPDHHGSLCLIRTLGRMGVSVYGVGSKPKSPGMLSRYCHDKFIIDVNAHPGKIVEFLCALARKLGNHPILTCTSDVSSGFIADNFEMLSQSYRLPNISSDLVRRLSDKKEMYHLCKKLAIPTAETCFPQCRQDVLRLIEGKSVLFPLMLKGIDGVALERRGNPRMVIVHNQDELLRRYDQMEDPHYPNLMLQEYIPGGDDSVWMFNGYFNEQSDCLLGFAGRKLRQHPVYTGATSLGICLRNQAIEDTTRRFMKAVGYRGVLDIGYRYDRRDGQYKALDINPRVGATFRLFVAQNGMDVVRAMYLDLTGQPVPDAPAREGRKWAVEDGDLISFHDYRKDGKLTFFEWVRSFRGLEETAWFAVDDPRPFADMSIRLSRLFADWSRRKLGFRRRALASESR